MPEEDIRPTPITPKDAHGMRCAMVVFVERPGRDDEIQEFHGVLRWTGRDLIFSHQKGEFVVNEEAARRLRRLHPKADAAKDVDVILPMLGTEGPRAPEGWRPTGLSIEGQEPPPRH